MKITTDPGWRFNWRGAEINGLEMNELRALLIQAAKAHPDTMQEIEAFVLERYPLDE